MITRRQQRSDGPPVRVSRVRDPASKDGRSHAAGHRPKRHSPARNRDSRGRQLLCLGQDL